jgi:TolA-binding protein
MATYNKRGYKAPKPAELNDVEPAEEVFDGKSTTAEVFNTLDQGASKTEEWVEKNQKVIFGVVGAIALVAIGWISYEKFIAAPKETEAAENMFQAEQYFAQAVDSPTATDSLYNLALNGGEGKGGFLDIIEQHPGTDAANLAHYNAGMCFLNIGKYKEAVSHLEEYKTKDDYTKAMALGATGDAFSQLKDYNSALEYYDRAISAVDDDLITPRFLYKAGMLSLDQNKKAEANKYFTQIKEKYTRSPEATNIDAYIAMTE